MSTYLNTIFTNKINKQDIHTIVECGSRDCLDAVALSAYYNAKVYAFECNPESIPICKKNIKDNDNVILIEKAVYKREGQITFFATDMEKSEDKNIGASSLLLHKDQIKYIQKRILVDSIRLDTFMFNENINSIDLLCMDLQGSELFALQGLGSKIANVNYLIIEVNFKSYYHSDILYPIILGWLHKYNFKELSWDCSLKRCKTFGNMLFKNMNYA